VPPDCNKVASVIWVFNSDIVSTSSSVITSTQFPSPSKNWLLPHSVVALESKVTKPASLVKSAKVMSEVSKSSSWIVSSSMCVVFTELAASLSDVTALSAMSAVAIVASTISLDSMSVPRVALIALLASMLMPVP